MALRLFGVDLRLSLAAESDSTLYGPLATYGRLVGPKASWQYYIQYDMQVLHQCQAAGDSARPCTYIGESDTLEFEVGEATLGHLSTLFYMTMRERLLTNPEPHMHATE